MFNNDMLAAGIIKADCVEADCDKIQLRIAWKHSTPNHEGMIRRIARRALDGQQWMGDQGWICVVVVANWFWWREKKKELYGRINYGKDEENFLDSDSIIYKGKDFLGYFLQSTFSFYFRIFL